MVSRGRVSGRGVDHGLDPAAQTPGLAAELAAVAHAAAQTYRVGQERRQRGHEPPDFRVVGELLFQVLYVSQKVGITVLDAARSPVVPPVAVHDEHAGQPPFSQRLPHHARRPRRSQPEEAQRRRVEEPGVAA